jgi:tryptophanyl-tRNA synthetase
VAALRFGSYAELKDGLIATIVDTLRPVRERYADIVADQGRLDEIRAIGAERARDRAAITLSRAKRAIGLVT